MAKEKLIAVKNDSKAKELVGWLCTHGATVVKTTGALIILAIMPQLLNAATKAEVKAFLDGKDGIAPGQKDSIQYTGSELWDLSHGDMNQNDGQWVKLFSWSYQVPFNWSAVVWPNARVKIEWVGPWVDDFWAWEDRWDIVSGGTTPLDRVSIDTYIKDGKIRIDAEVQNVVNVDRVEMQVGLWPSKLAPVDTIFVENKPDLQKLNFEMSIDELIKKYNITSPTVFYVRLEVFDKNWPSKKTKLQAVEIHPDGKIVPLQIFPNIAEVADRIKFIIPWDQNNQYPVRVVELSTGRIVWKKILSGGEHTVGEIVNGVDLTSGHFSVQVMTKELERKPGRFTIAD